MSLSWPDLKQRLTRGAPLRVAMPRMRLDRVDVLLAPTEVQLVRRPARGSALERRYPVNEPTWQTAAAALAHGLSELGWRNARLQVRLSNHFVRYALVPGADKLRNQAERIAAAQHQLRSLYGERADTWLIVPATVRGDNRLVAAVDKGLVETLAAATAGPGLQLRRVEALLIWCYNQVRRRIDNRPTWLTIVEPGRLCVAYFDNKAWGFVRNERLRSAPQEEIPVILERLCLAEGAKPGRVLMFGADLSFSTWNEAWTVEHADPLRDEALA
ncbi:MAG TPA: hypothetical protein VJU83_12985 [Burkholderiales bacterium]|nr:hypothetical protein [Burkholderiales bacterium]